MELYSFSSLFTIISFYQNEVQGSKSPISRIHVRILQIKIVKWGYSSDNHWRHQWIRLPSQSLFNLRYYWQFWKWFHSHSFLRVPLSSRSTRGIRKIAFSSIHDQSHQKIQLQSGIQMLFAQLLSRDPPRQTSRN
jgi:hypothetical protein